MLVPWPVVSLLLLLAATTVIPSEAGSLEWYSTMKNGSYRLVNHNTNGLIKQGIFSSIVKDEVDPVYTIGSQTSQKMYGGGASLTKSAAQLLIKMKQKKSTNYWNTLERLFKPGKSDGAAMRVVRVPISASDFSDSDWTYDDHTDDYGLKFFKLAHSADDVIPVLQDIINGKGGSNPIQSNLCIMLCPWTPPIWLKTPSKWDRGELIDTDTVYEFYAKYLWHTVSEFNKLVNNRVKYLSLQNEPLHYFKGGSDGYPALDMDEASMARLALALDKASNKVAGVDLIIYDHNWDRVDYPITVLNTVKKTNSALAKNIKVAWHCYEDDGYWKQKDFTDKYPENEQFFTECTGTFAYTDFGGNLEWMSEKLFIGSTDYGSSMVLNNWNLALDENNGPQNGGCSNCRGSITINTRNNYQVKYNEEFYGVAHYGRYLTNDGRSYLMSLSSSTSQPCGYDWQGVPIKGNFTVQASQIGSSRTLQIVVYNFCWDDKSHLVTIQRSNPNKYITFEAVWGLNTLKWSE